MDKARGTWSRALYLRSVSMEKPGVLMHPAADIDRDHAQDERLSTGRSRPWVAGLLALVGALAFSVLGLVRLSTYRTGIYYMVIFDQAVRGYSQFAVPGSYVKDQWNQLGVAVSVLGDHFSPILALISPLYWLHDGPETLIVAQAFLLAAASLPLWAFVVKALGRRAAYCASVAYLLSWPVAEAVAFPFHEYAFMPLLTALLFERVQAGRKGHAAIVCVLLLLVKEDVGFFVAGIGLALLLKKGWRPLGALIDRKS